MDHNPGMYILDLPQMESPQTESPQSTASFDHPPITPYVSPTNLRTAAVSEETLPTSPVLSSTADNDDMAQMARMLSQFATSQASFHATVLQRLTRLEETVRTIAANQDKIKEALTTVCKKKTVHIDTKRNVFHEPLPSPVDMSMTPKPSVQPEPLLSTHVECPVCKMQVPRSVATDHVNHHFEKPVTPPLPRGCNRRDADPSQRGPRPQIQTHTERVHAEQKEKVPSAGSYGWWVQKIVPNALK